MTHDDWMQAATEEYRRLIDLLEQLDAEEWAAPTDCTGWDVRAMVAHLAGAAQAMARVRELIRQLRGGRRLLPDADGVDGMNELQVRERADHDPAQLLAELAQAAPRAVRARSRLPWLVRAMPVPFGPPLGTKPLGYLMDRIYTRDAWLHRVDICRATGRPMLLTAEQDGRIVDDVVVEWAELHGQPFELVLTGPAGGRWQRAGSAPIKRAGEAIDGEAAQRGETIESEALQPGAGAEPIERGAGSEPARRDTSSEAIELDAVEFCRILSGRASGSGLLTTRVDF